METRNNTLPFELPVECRCVPSSPFYVRWLNRFGGIDYWMFQKRQTYSRKLDGYEDYQPYITDYSQATGTNAIINKNVSETVLVGAENLTSDEWYELSRIAYSPIIQWYREGTGTWVDLLADKSESQMITDNARHSIEISFVLPTPQLQF